MEKDNNIKRGVDFATRVGRTASPFRQAFSWWKGQKLNRRTLWTISIVWLLNLIIIAPVLGKDLSPAYSSSSILILISEFVSRFLFIPQYYFFLLLTFLALTFAPVGFYLFVRRIALRHEVTALIAAILFILPNPFFGNYPSLLGAVMKGDGAHVLAISFIPFFLLYVQAFLASGTPVLFLLSSVGIAYIAILSPFSAYNFLIFFLVILLAEGFQGNLRVKLIRGIILIATAAGLSFFWYYPGKIVKFMELPYIQDTISKFLGILPAAIPVIPVAGALAFLLFDRRAKLKPIFVSLSLFLIYAILFWINSQLGISGILEPDRYFPELALSASLILAISIIFLIEIFFKRLVSKTQGRLRFAGLILVFTFIAASLSFLSINSIFISHNYLANEQVYDNYNEGRASIRGAIDWNDPTAIFALFVSVADFALLIYLLRKYPINLSKKKS